MQRDFLDDDKVVVLRVCPVDEPDRFRRLACFDLHRDPVAEKGIDRLVVFLEASVRIIRLDVQEMEGSADLVESLTGLHQVGGQYLLVDVAVVSPIRTISEIAIIQGVAEQGDHAVLGFSLGFDDGAHGLEFVVRFPAM